MSRVSFVVFAWFLLIVRIEWFSCFAWVEFFGWLV